MATRADPNSLNAFGIEAVNVVRRQISPFQGLVREVTISLARFRFGGAGGGACSSFSHASAEQKRGFAGRRPSQVVVGRATGSDSFTAIPTAAQKQ